MKAYAASFTIALSVLRIVRAQNVSITIPTQSPSSAVSVAQDLVAFSIEQDRWTDWIGTDAPNTFWLNALENLKQLSGLPTRIRIGADSEDHTNFSFDVEYATDVFPAITATVPYPEATNITAGQGFYNLAAHLPSGTPVIWGVNFGGNNITAAYLQTVAICKAFTSSAMKNAHVTLQAIEIGNEADLYHNNGLRNSSYSITNYVPEWTKFATNVTKTANALLGKEVALQGIAFAESSHTTSGFSPEAAFKLGILNSDAGSQVKWISQHHYSGSFCSGSESLLQNLMNKASIRGNVTAFSPDISAAHALGLPYVFGETNSYSCHGAPGVSDTAGASLWALYVLFSAIAGMERVYFHEGIGYKYNFIQPVTLTRSIDDGSALSTPLAPHIQPAYYAAIIAAEAIGTSGATTISELTLNNSQLSGYAFYENGALKRALFINLVAFNGAGAARSAVHVALGGSGNITVKRLSIPTAESTSGVTWGGQTYETSNALVSGKLQTQTVPVSTGVDVHETEVVLVTFQ
ncbi:glycoside hydrolase family 79 protein [Peniophora sp. CONT]|nr:glycoside hydrolase family 79 protein [Peniophora sp. CONT]